MTERVFELSPSAASLSTLGRDDQFLWRVIERLQERPDAVPVGPLEAWRAWAAERSTVRDWREQLGPGRSRSVRSLHLAQADLALALAYRPDGPDAIAGASEANVSHHAENMIRELSRCFREPVSTVALSERTSQFDGSEDLLQAAARGASPRAGAVAATWLDALGLAKPMKEVWRITRLPLVFTAMGAPFVGRLTLRWIERDGGAEPVIVPSRALGFCSIAPDFLRAIDDAFEWAFHHAAFPPGTIVTWSIDLKDQDVTRGFEGPSAGAAFAVGLGLLRDKRTANPQVAISAAIVDPKKGTVGRVGGAKTKGRPRPNAMDTIRRIAWSKDQEPSLLTQLEDHYGVQSWRAGDVHGLRQMTQTRFAAVLQFLDALGGRARGLESNMAYAPKDGVDLRRFCLRPLAFGDESKGEREAGIYGDVGDEAPETKAVGRQFADWLRGDEHTVVLKGEPGSGKTIALWLAVTDRYAMLHDHAKSGDLDPESPSFRLPLALPLRGVGGDDAATNRPIADLALAYAIDRAFDKADAQRVKTRLEDVAARRAVPDDDSLATLASWLHQKRVTGAFDVFLDALDEYRGDVEKDLQPELSAIRTLELGGYARLVITTRIGQGADRKLVRTDEGVLRLRMAPFQREDVRRYVREYFHVCGQPELADEVLNEIHKYPGPSQLARVVLLLAMICDLKWREPDEPLPTTRTALAKRATELFIQRQYERRRHAPEDEWVVSKGTIEALSRKRTPPKLRALETLAALSYGAEPEPIAKESALAILEQLKDQLERTRPLPELSWEEEMLAELSDEEDGILVPVSSTSYRFPVRTFHEFFFGRWLAGQLPDDRETLKGLVGGRVDVWAAWLGERRAEIAPASKAPDLGEGECALGHGAYRNVWPFVAGALADLDRRDAAFWLIDAFADLLEAQDADERDNDLLLTAARAGGELGPADDEDDEDAAA